jgi:O-acetyl-ADP-ribose deacetylase (regulator of RNase III)
MLKYARGDVLRAEANIIAHGVNCIGAFGAGVAGQIRQKWPEVYRAYLTKHKLGDGWHLGDWQLVQTQSNKLIANLATQHGYGYTDGQTVFADYNAIRTCMRSLFKYAQEHKLSIAMPKIGAGLAGGDWNIISQIIGDELNGYPDLKVTVYEL